MEESNNLIGVIYPLPIVLVDNLKSKRKNVFVKFTSGRITNKTETKIKEGIKLYIYQSWAEKTIVAEAVISRVEYLLLGEVIKKYKDQLITPPSKLREYAVGRESKKLLVLILKNIHFYEKSRKISKPITMTGMYITKENIKLIK